MITKGDKIEFGTHCDGFRCFTGTLLNGKPHGRGFGWINVLLFGSYKGDILIEEDGYWLMHGRGKFKCRLPPKQNDIVFVKGGWVTRKVYESVEEWENGNAVIDDSDLHRDDEVSDHYDEESD